MPIRKAAPLFTAMILAAAWSLPHADAAEQSDSPAAGAITGRILDTQNNPTAGAIVVLCAEAGGIAVHSRTFRPITEAFTSQKGKPDKEIAYAVTDDEGRFSFDGVAPGKYRLVAPLLETG